MTLTSHTYARTVRTYICMYVRTYVCTYIWYVSLNRFELRTKQKRNDDDNLRLSAKILDFSKNLRSYDVSELMAPPEQRRGADDVILA